MPEGTSRFLNVFLLTVCLEAPKLVYYPTLFMEVSLSLGTTRKGVNGISALSNIPVSLDYCKFS